MNRRVITFPNQLCKKWNPTGKDGIGTKIVRWSSVCQHVLLFTKIKKVLLVHLLLSLPFRYCLVQKHFPCITQAIRNCLEFSKGK